MRERALACGRHRRHGHPSPFSLKCGKTNDRPRLAPANENQTQSPAQSLPLPFPFSGLEPATGQDKGLWWQRGSKAPLEAAAPRAQGPGQALAHSLARKSFKLTDTQPREEAPGQRAISFLRRLAFNWLQVASALSAACQGQGRPFMSPHPRPPRCLVSTA